MDNPLDKVPQVFFLSILLLALQSCLSLFSTAYAITSNNNENFSDQVHHDNNHNNILSFERIATLVVDTAASIYRMFAALGLSFIVAIAVGLTAAVRPLASRILIPIIDIL